MLDPGNNEALQPLRRGWCLGREEFRQHKLAQLEGQVGQQHFGQMPLELAHAKAGRIISEELCRLDWGGDLVSRRKRDPSKLEIGLYLRRETTLSVKEIATRLHLRTPASASVVLLAAMHRPRAGSLSAGRLEL